MKIFGCDESDLESISDSDNEIYLNQLVEPVNNNNQPAAGELELEIETPLQDLNELNDKQELNGTGNYDELEQISDDEIIIDPLNVNNHRVVVDDQNYQDDNARPREQQSTATNGLDPRTTNLLAGHEDIIDSDRSIPCSFISGMIHLIGFYPTITQYPRPKVTAL
ncbi:unnamed protein product [Adineta steineri]|uniref:Uncharacterized protein n=1 Tax=Adineta steineri TaxID=433720 RepID=A0A815F6E1_9BILA|nr:unnamed protein product [Adineta steineri]